LTNKTVKERATCRSFRIHNTKPTQMKSRAWSKTWTTTSQQLGGTRTRA
jgi:hypothetical protein